MTENELREKVVNTAIKYLGCKESDGSHKKIIDIYNEHKPLARGYKVTYKDAWCATFVSAVSILCELTDIMPTECSCGAMITLYQKLGKWVENDAYVPKIGDILMYDWDDNGVGDNTGAPDHVGIVTKVSGTTITVIEGNKSDAVAYRTMTVNGKYIRGYCTPDYASKATTSATSSAATAAKPATPSTDSGTTLNRASKWQGKVTASSLNVRTWAGTANPTCSFSPLKKDTIVDVCDSVKASDGAVWYYIKYGDKYGFVHSTYIKEYTAPAATPAPAPSTPSNSSSSTSTSTSSTEYAKSFSASIAGTYKVTASSGLNLRSGAGTNFAVKCTIPKGDKVNCYGYYTTVGSTKWYYVAYKTYTGFVSSTYLSK